MVPLSHQRFPCNWHTCSTGWHLSDGTVLHVSLMCLLLRIPVLGNWYFSWNLIHFFTTSVSHSWGRSPSLWPNYLPLSLECCYSGHQASRPWAFARTSHTQTKAGTLDSTDSRLLTELNITLDWKCVVSEVGGYERLYFPKRA